MYVLEFLAPVCVRLHDRDHFGGLHHAIRKGELPSLRGVNPKDYLVLGCPQLADVLVREKHNLFVHTCNNTTRW